MKSKFWGGVFLICGTSVGTGILGIPIVTAESGLSYSLCLFVCCWFFSLWAALYYMEAHVWQEDIQSNLLSMSETFFGSRIKVVIWLIYLALLYSLMCTYLLAGSSWMIHVIQVISGYHWSSTMGMLAFIAAIGLFIFFGIRVVDRVNRWMSLGLVLSFMAILSMLLPSVDTALWAEKIGHWQAMPKALPLLITAFGYSIIIPSLNAYLNRKPYVLQKAIVIGSVLIALVYMLWELGTLGHLPLTGGAHSLAAILTHQDHGTEVAQALIYFSHNPLLSVCLTTFAVFAVITSFLGVSMALYHTLSDGLKLDYRGRSGLLLLVMTYIPPMLFLKISPSGFSQILSWAGALVSLLMGIIPVVMVWRGRYVHGYTGYRVYGGKSALILVGLFFFMVMCIECFG